MKFIGAASLTGMILAVAGCGSSGRIDGGGGGSGSELTAINIALPDRNNLKNQVADIETKMNGYHFVVTPVDGACAGATKVDELADYKNAATLGASLKQGCDYDVVLSLGNKAAGGGQVQPPPPQNAAPSYEGKIKSIIDSKCISCHPGSRTSDLRTFAGAKQFGADSARRVASGGMPMGSTMSQADKDAFKAWADAGFPEKDQQATTPSQPPIAPAGKLTAVYYKNNTLLRIRKEDIAGKAEYKVTLPLQLQEGGRTIGLGSANANPNTGGGQQVQPQPSQPQQPQPPAQPPVNLSGEKDFDVKDAAGQSAKISKHFKGQYMLIDFSASNCGYCRQRAGEMNRDTNLQKLLSGEKCSHATVVPANDLEAWFDATGGDSVFTSKHAYAANTGNLGRLAKAFGINFIGTPTFLLIDAQGKVLADDNAVPTAAIEQYCK